MSDPAPEPKISMDPANWETQPINIMALELELPKANSKVQSFEKTLPPQLPEDRRQAAQAGPARTVM